MQNFRLKTPKKYHSICFETFGIVMLNGRSVVKFTLRLRKHRAVKANRVEVYPHIFGTLVQDGGELSHSRLGHIIPSWKPTRTVI